MLAAAQTQDAPAAFEPDDAAVVENMKMGEMADMQEQAMLGKLFADEQAAAAAAETGEAVDAAADSAETDAEGEEELPPGAKQHQAETHVAAGSKKHNAESHKPKPKSPTWNPVSSHLRSTADLTGKCFGFPTANFNHANNVAAKYPNDPTHFVEREEDAIDFKLATLDGEKVVLSDLLKEKPVLLLYGMYTCPAFQGYYSSKKTTSHMSKFDEYALVEKYADSVNFVHLYTTEPHPKKPDKNFDTGMIVEFPWSTVRPVPSADQKKTARTNERTHARTRARIHPRASNRPPFSSLSQIRNPKQWTDRKFAAEMIKDDLHPAELLLIDNLGGPTMLDHGVEEPPYNPVWCSYGPGARQAFLIARSGRMYDVQAWFHASTMAGAIEELLLLESGLVNTTDLEDFRQRRTDEHAVVESDVSSLIQEALMVAADGMGEAVGDTEQYEKDSRGADAEVSKARVILDEYTSKFVDQIYEAKGLVSPNAETNSYSTSKLETNFVEEDNTLPPASAVMSLSAAAPVVGLAAAFIVVGAVVRRWRQSQPDSYHSVSGEDADEI